MAEGLDGSHSSFCASSRGIFSWCWFLIAGVGSWPEQRRIFFSVSWVTFSGLGGVGFRGLSLGGSSGLDGASFQELGPAVLQFWLCLLPSGVHRTEYVSGDPFIGVNKKDYMWPP